jgi:hypothetical protein
VIRAVEGGMSRNAAGRRFQTQLRDRHALDGRSPAERPDDRVAPRGRSAVGVGLRRGPTCCSKPFRRLRTPRWPSHASGCSGSVARPLRSARSTIPMIATLEHYPNWLRVFGHISVS